MPDFDPDDCGQYLRFYQDNANEQVNAVLDSAVALIRPFTHKIISVKPRTDTANVCNKEYGKRMVQTSQRRQRKAVDLPVRQGNRRPDCKILLSPAKPRQP